MSSFLDLDKMAKLASKRRDMLKEVQKASNMHVNDPGKYSPQWAKKWVSPITESAHGTDSGVMIVLNNWATIEETIEWNDMEKRKVRESGYICKKLTNKRLDKQLCKNGWKRSDVYITNSFPYVAPKEPKIPARCLQLVYTELLLQEIRIVKPKLIICCGVPAESAIWYVKPMIRFKVKVPKGVSHPAAFVSNDERDKEWRCVLKRYHGLRHK